MPFYFFPVPLIIFFALLAYVFVRRLTTPVFILTDCQDPNARMRMEARCAAMFRWSRIHFVGVKNTLEAGGCLVDLLDALFGKQAIVLVNVAPRNGEAKKHTNGTPFGFCRVGNALVFGTVDGYIFSFLEKVLEQKLTVNVFDIPVAVRHLGLSAAEQERVIRTQFRSFEFLPRVAHAVWRGKDIPATKWSEAPPLPARVWWVDCFGNCKTTLLPQEVGFRPEATIRITVQGRECDLPCYARLADIPDGVIGLTVGSSGLGNYRWLEIMKQGASAAEALEFTAVPARPSMATFAV